jgi:hypothetical protein
LGQPPETDWPYDPVRDYLATTYHPPAAAFTSALAHVPRLGRALPPAVHELRAALLVGELPLLVIVLYSTWYTTQADGMIPMPTAGSTPSGGHAVLVVGHDDHSGRFIIRNSWGPTWGRDGYGFLPEDYVTAYGRDAWLLARQ